MLPIEIFVYHVFRANSIIFMTFILHLNVNEVAGKKLSNDPDHFFTAYCEESSHGTDIVWLIAWLFAYYSLKK